MGLIINEEKSSYNVQIYVDIDVCRNYTINTENYLRGAPKTIEKFLKEKYSYVHLDYTLGENYSLIVESNQKFDKYITNIDCVHRVGRLTEQIDDDVKTLLNMLKKPKD